VQLGLSSGPVSPSAGGRRTGQACCVAVLDGADQALPEVPLVGQRVHHPEEV
jgi:hypothetical protein